VLQESKPPTFEADGSSIKVHWSPIFKKPEGQGSATKIHGVQYMVFTGNRHSLQNVCSIELSNKQAIATVATPVAKVSKIHANLYINVIARIEERDGSVQFLAFEPLKIDANAFGKGDLTLKFAIGGTLVVALLAIIAFVFRQRGIYLRKRLDFEM